MDLQLRDGVALCVAARRGDERIAAAPLPFDAELDVAFVVTFAEPESRRRARPRRARSSARRWRSRRTGSSVHAPGARRGLRDTIRVLAETDLKLGVAAARLQVHPNTLQYRVRRIQERTGRNPRRVADLLELLDRDRAR